jgi:hypothetical protein
MLGTAGAAAAAAPRTKGPPPGCRTLYARSNEWKVTDIIHSWGLLSSSWAIFSYYWPTCFSYLKSSSQGRACGFPAHSQWRNAIPANQLKSSTTVVTSTLFNLSSVEETHVRYIHIYMCVCVCVCVCVWVVLWFCSNLRFWANFWIKITSGFGVLKISKEPAKSPQRTHPEPMV